VLYKDADWTWRSLVRRTGSSLTRGQCCNAGSRLYIERDVYDEVVQGVSDEAKKIKVGSGLDADNQMGPLISSEQHDKVLGTCPRVLTLAPARRPAAVGRASAGYFVEPTAAD